MRRGRALRRRYGRAGTESPFDAALQTFLAAPSANTWDELAHKIIPGTMRTVWQAWTTVDPSAPHQLPSAPIGRPLSAAKKWSHWPDEFTLQRALQKARAGRVPVGLGALMEEQRRQPRIPGRRPR